jgi:thioredoxin 1
LIHSKKPSSLFYATWCGPCMLLKLKTFPNKHAGQFFNANFVNLSLDGEKGQGLKLFQACRLKAFPTLLILNSDGKPLLAAEDYSRHRKAEGVGYQPI